MAQIIEYFTTMTPLETVGQIIGFIGTTAFFISYQQKAQKRIIFYQIIGISMFVIHFFMLKAYTGAVLNVLGVIRAVVYYNADKKWAQSKLWFYGLLLTYMIAGIFIWEDWFSILPIFAMILSTFAFITDNPLRFRILNFPCSPIWLIYNIHHHSISGSITECFTMTSMIIAFFRYYVIKSAPKDGKEQ